jgi:hypothetical protein
MTARRFSLLRSLGTLPELSTASHAATWIVKRWQVGGARDGAMGLSVPREVLAWQQELLQPSAMPEGIVRAGEIALAPNSFALPVETFLAYRTESF